MACRFSPVPGVSVRTGSYGQQALWHAATLRALSLTEREKLMGFPEGYIAFALNPKLTIQQQFDQGACFIGNSFSVHVIAMLMDSLVAAATQVAFWILDLQPRKLGVLPPIFMPILPQIVPPNC